MSGIVASYARFFKCSKTVVGRMQLVHFGVKLEFAEKSQLPSPAEAVYRAITGKKPDKSKVAEPGAHILVSDTRVDIFWHFDECRIILEDASGLERCVETALLWLSQIDKVAPMGKIDGTQVITYWLLPTPSYDFISLERKYREKMIANNEDISKGTFDSSIVLDISMSDCTLHHQSGAMKRQQLLKEYLTFGSARVPEVFLFLEASIINKDKVEYSKDDMYKRLSAFFNHCMAHSNAFGQIWKEAL